MNIIREERKAGIYAQWFEVIGINPKGEKVRYIIYKEQADTYEKAEEYFNEHWGSKGHIGITLVNAAPFDIKYAMAC